MAGGSGAASGAGVLGVLASAEDGGASSVWGPSVASEKWANWAVVSLLGLQLVSWPPWKVEKKMPVSAPPPKFWVVA